MSFNLDLSVRVSAIKSQYFLANTVVIVCMSIMLPDSLMWFFVSMWRSARLKALYIMFGF